MNFNNAVLKSLDGIHKSKTYLEPPGASRGLPPAELNTPPPPSPRKREPWDGKI